MRRIASLLAQALNGVLNKERLLFCTSVLFVVISIGLTRDDTPNDPDTSEQAQHQHFAHIAANQISSADYQRCSDEQPSDNLIPKTFVTAVIAVENYGRPPLRRWLEETLARIDLALLGKVPDYSLGIGQLRPSTARLVIQQTASEDYNFTPNDSELLGLLADPCENFKLVHSYLYTLMSKSGFASLDKESAWVILKEYNGQRELEHQEIYQEVVWNVFRFYQNSDSQHRVASGKNKL